jgi:hypothetical protein
MQVRSTQAIRRKFGTHCFERWGEKGGNEALIAQREHRLVILKKPRKRSKKA